MLILLQSICIRPYSASTVEYRCISPFSVLGEAAIVVLSYRAPRCDWIRPKSGQARKEEQAGPLCQRVSSNLPTPIQVSEWRVGDPLPVMELELGRYFNRAME